MIAHLRERGVPWREIAHHRGLQSAQAAQQRYERLTRPPEAVIYAFRAADEPGAPWHGTPDALTAGQYQTGTIDFNPAAPRPYSGRMLELLPAGGARDAAAEDPVAVRTPGTLLSAVLPEALKDETDQPWCG